MNVERLPHYGQDILSMTKESKMSLGKKLLLLQPVLVYAKNVIAALGWRGAFQSLKMIEAEVKNAKAMDWSTLKEKGLSDDDLNQIIQKIVIAKVMADKLGMEKAASLRNALSDKISITVFEEMFAPAQVFQQCGNGDFLPPFKKYYIALMNAMAKKGLEEAEVVIDEADEFQLNVTYCAWAEAAKALGTPQYCYYSTCYGDEVFFPVLAEQAGFHFQRTGTLAQGAPACDFRFTRKLN